MATSQEIRNLRLKSDYKEMCNIRGPVISWRATRGTPPYVEEYLLTVNLRSIIGEGPTYRDQHIISVELPGGYPTTPPHVVMVSEPVVFHPNWWAQKHWCYGTWDISEGLGHHLIRMLRTLQYDPVITLRTETPMIGISAISVRASFHVTGRRCQTPASPRLKSRRSSGKSLKFASREVLRCASIRPRNQ
jgi:ubiquitin-protein ligase